MNKEKELQATEIQPLRDALLSEVFKKHDAFFAFSDKQYEEQKKPEIEYLYSRSLNMFYNIKGKGQIYKDMEEAIDKATAQDKENNSKEAIILRELLNYECFYTGNPEDAIEALDSSHSYTKEEVLEVFRANFNRIVEQYG